MFDVIWTDCAQETYDLLKLKALQSRANRKQKQKTKSTKDEGLFKQVHNTIQKLKFNTRHAGLHTHEYDDLDHPYNQNEKVFEAYAQNNTPGAYRVFWCYGPLKGQLTIIEISPHP